jgi:hypothetical protein
MSCRSLVLAGGPVDAIAVLVGGRLHRPHVALRSGQIAAIATPRSWSWTCC